MNLEIARRKFETAKSIASQRGARAPQMAKLRIAMPFVKGQNFFDIDIKDALKTHKNNVGLSYNDIFVSRAIAFGIMVEDDTLKGYAPTLSYPLQKSANVTAAGLKGLDNAQAYVLYNGSWSLRTNQDVNFQKAPLTPFLHVPASLPEKVFATNLEDAAFEHPEDITLVGNVDHFIRVEYPADANSDIKGEAGSTAYLVMEIYGWLIQNAAKN